MSTSTNASHEEIETFFKLYEERRFNAKKNVHSVVSNYADGVKGLEQAVAQWEMLLTQLRATLSTVNSEQWQEICSQSETLLELGQKSLLIYEQAKGSIFVEKLAEIQKEIVDGIGKLLQVIDDALRLCVPEKSAQIAIPALLYQTIISMLGTNKITLGQAKRRLISAKLKIKGQTNSSSKRTRRKLLSLKQQFVLFLVLVSTNWWLPPEALVNLKLIAKLFIILIVLIWFPTQFVPSFKNYRITSLLFGALIWGCAISFWVYEFPSGFVILILVVYPLIRLLGTPKGEIDRNAQSVVQRVYWSMGVSLVLAGILLRENMWIIGAVIWWTFMAVSTLSFRHFRSTFDMVDALDPKRNSSEVKRRLLYFTFTATVAILVLLSIVAGNLEREFVLTIYSQASTISFGVVALVFAVQAVIPSISTWGGSELQTRTASQVREMKLLLRTSKGLMGFLQTFFVAFLLSLLGWGIASITSAQMEKVVDLSPQFLAFPTSNIIDLLVIPTNFQYSPEVTLVFIQTVLFAVLISTFSYSLAILYYLFIATNTLTLPIQDALLSQPVLIQVPPRPRPNQDERLTEKLKESLQKKRRLRGEVITDLLVSNLENGDKSAIIQISGDFDSTSEVMEKAMILFEAAFQVHGVQQVQVLVHKTSFGAVESQKLFSLTIKQEEFDFLKNKTEGMGLEYKMMQLGAHLARHFLPESQIL
jgi:hypothetical protein